MNKLIQMGFAHGVSDHDNKISDLSLIADPIEFGSFYLEAYKKGYKEAAAKSWYMVSLDKETNTPKSFLIDLGEKGNTWTDDKAKATKFPTREAVTDRLSNFSCGRGNYGMIWE